jgi:hypothetical protein
MLLFNFEHPSVDLEESVSCWGLVLSLEFKDEHLLIEHLGWEADVLCCLKLVASQHPDLHAGIIEIFYCLRDAILKLVLKGSGA